jgi:probable blue pigment (indigoidine) exporter
MWTAGATALAPISWGTSYITITELLPDDRPLLVATVRVVPSGLVLLLAGLLGPRWRPRGADWWRTGVLAVANFGAFFPLLIVAVYRLPGGVAAAVGGLQPLLVGAVSWLATRQRPRPLDLAVGCVAALGVGLVVIRPGADLDAVGILAAVGANLSFAVGVVLTKRFPRPTNLVAATGWQLLLGGAVLLPLMAIVEGRPPSVTGDNVAGFAYLSLVATALAFVLWFNGIRRLPTAAPPLLGLSAPVTGAIIGWTILGQSLSPLQLTGFVIALGAIGYGASMPGASDRLRSRAGAELPTPGGGRIARRVQERGQAIDCVGDVVAAGAEADAEVARHAETVARCQQHAVGGRSFAEGSARLARAQPRPRRQPATGRNPSDPIGVVGEERLHGPEVGAGDSLRPLEDPVAFVHADDPECLAEG